jgi:lysophospholipase L1-like esterase
MAATRIVMLGDCTLATTYLPAAFKNETRLAHALTARYPHDRIEVINEGLDGESVQDFLRRYPRVVRRVGTPDYVIVRYGVQDRRRYGVAGFRHQLQALCDRFRTDFPHVRIVLETGIYVDYPAHYEFDRNRVLQPLYNVIRELGRQYSFPVVDIYERMARETTNGNWDLRVRGYGIVDDEIPVLGAGQDHLHVGDVRWFTNIHPNPQGIDVIVDEEVRVFGEHWPVSLRIPRVAEHRQPSRPA